MSITNIGMVANEAVKFSRDAMHCAITVARGMPCVGMRVFMASGSTSIANLKSFASSGIDAMIFAGVRIEKVLAFAGSMPRHPPIVVIAGMPPSPGDVGIYDVGGVVWGDNIDIGRLAAEHFLHNGHRNFAFMDNRSPHDWIIGDERCKGLQGLVAERLGGDFSFSRFRLGRHDEDTGDFVRAARRISRPPRTFRGLDGGVRRGQVEAVGRETLHLRRNVRRQDDPRNWTLTRKEQHDENETDDDAACGCGHGGGAEYDGKGPPDWS